MAERDPDRWFEGTDGSDGGGHPAGGDSPLQIVQGTDAEAQAELARQAQGLPDALPILPLREMVMYPDTVTPLAVAQERSVKLINDILSGQRQLVLVAARDPSIEVPGPDDLYEVGVAGVVARMMKVPDGSLRVLIQGSQRVRIGDYTAEEPYLVARISELPDEGEQTDEIEALAHNVQRTFSQIIDEIPYLPEELQLAVANVADPSALTHLIASALRIEVSEKQELLELTDVSRRLRRLSEILTRELEVITLGAKIQDQVQSELEQGQREYYLRQQLKAIREELGETEEGAEVGELRSRIENAEPPEHVMTAAERELSRLEQLPAAAAEHGVIRTYLEWLAEVPWSKTTEDNLDIDNAREVLDADHYDLERVKDRIVEHLAVRRLAPDSPSPILCFVGPPGVGKTSLGQSIARALGREFQRLSVGGVRDESEIRGHRRTYIGAMPGTIVRAIRDAGTRNPVMMIDEIDKMGADFRGDPASAMLEVLDPEQNESFRDHYLDLALDLSDVMFITTANQLEPIPPALQDRMEVIHLAGYTPQEKLHIAKRYLVPRQLERNGLAKSQLDFADAALRTIIDEYTREAGVRNLEREIGTVCRKIAVDVARKRGKARKVTISGKRARELLGPRRVWIEAKRRTRHPGVATGLAWTPVGGEVLFVEAAAMPGKGELTITGQLGDVMRESAQAALSYVRRNVETLAPDLSEKWFAEHDLHVHVPSGAVPKDGPSAGVPMATALASLVSERRVDADLGMTGEITLTGEVLPIGGVKEKVLAAQRAGITRVALPTRNEGDVSEIEQHERRGLEFVYADRIDDVLDTALVGKRGRARSGQAS